jgi:hypothetical protein
MVAPAMARAAEPAAAVRKRGLRLKTVSVGTMVLALGCLLAFPFARDQVAGKGTSVRRIFRTSQHVKTAGRAAWVVNSKT